MGFMRRCFKFLVKYSLVFLFCIIKLFFLAIFLEMVVDWVKANYWEINDFITWLLIKLKFLEEIPLIILPLDNEGRFIMRFPFVRDGKIELKIPLVNKKLRIPFPVTKNEKIELKIPLVNKKFILPVSLEKDGSIIIQFISKEECLFLQNEYLYIITYLEKDAEVEEKKKEEKP